MRHIPILILATCWLFSAAAHATAGPGFKEVSFATDDGGMIFANLYGDGGDGVVLAHGAVFNKESWQPLAEHLAEKGLSILAIDFRGYGKSKAGSSGRVLYQDVLGAVRYLHTRGTRTVSVVGGSMGGSAAARAAVEAKEGEIHHLVLLSAGSVSRPADLQAAARLFVASEGEGMAARVRRHFEQAAEPKELALLPGRAHAQHIFKTDQAEKLTALILRFLKDGPKRN